MSRRSTTGVYSKTPAITAGAYSAGDGVGGLLKFAQAAGAFSNAVLQSLVVKEKGTQKAALSFLFFREAPTGIPADNGAFTFTAADLAKCVGRVEVATTDYVTLGTYSVAVVYPGLVVSGHADTGPATDVQNAGDLWVAIILPAGSAPTYGSTSDLIIELGMLQD